MSATTTPTDAKAAAVRQWTQTPCGPAVAGDPGTAEYFEQLDQGRRDYAPWMDAALAYDQTAELDVLDVGCGQGIDLVRYARAGAHATGVDLTPRHVEIASMHLSALRLPGSATVSDAEHLPFPDGSFDVASSNGVLHHTPDMPAALSEIRRVLRPGGRATIIVYNRNSLHYWLHQVAYNGLARGMLLRERSMTGVLATTVENGSRDTRPLVRVYSPRQTAALLRAAGFVDVHVTVRHLRSFDSIPTRAIRSQSTLDRLGRRLGWYVIARGTRPPSG